MAWVKLDDRFPDHEKVAKAGPLASWLYVCGLAYCNRMLTDGFIPAAIVRRLADLDDHETQAARLVDAGFWEPREVGYRVHDYLGSSLVSDQDLFDQMRAEARRQHALIVFERDGYRCLTCGASADLTLDHIIALTRGGTNEPENLQTLCRSCNSRKGNR